MLIIFSLFESVIKRYENSNGEHTIFVHRIRPIVPTSLACVSILKSSLQDYPWTEPNINP
jgi:hypothetical protein